MGCENRLRPIAKMQGQRAWRCVFLTGRKAAMCLLSTPYGVPLKLSQGKLVAILGVPKWAQVFYEATQPVMIPKQCITLVSDYLSL